MGPGRARDGPRATPRDADGGVSRAHGRDGVGGGGPRRRVSARRKHRRRPRHLRRSRRAPPRETLPHADADGRDSVRTRVGRRRRRRGGRRIGDDRHDDEAETARGDTGPRAEAPSAGTTSWALGEISARALLPPTIATRSWTRIDLRSSARSGADARGTSRKRCGLILLGVAHRGSRTSTSPSSRRKGSSDAAADGEG